MRAALRLLLPLLSLVVVPLPGRSAGAQSGPALQPGTRVRVSADAPPISRFETILLAYTADTLTLRRTACRRPMPAAQVQCGDSALRVPVSALRRLEVSAGGRSRVSGVARGAMWGTLVGAGAGALIGAVSMGSCRDDAGDGLFPCRAIPLVYAIAAAVPGLAVGGLVGGMRAGERWRPVSIGVASNPAPPAPTTAAGIPARAAPTVGGGLATRPTASAGAGTRAAPPVTAVRVEFGRSEVRFHEDGSGGALRVARSPNASDRGRVEVGILVGERYRGADVGLELRHPVGPLVPHAGVGVGLMSIDVPPDAPDQDGGFLRASYGLEIPIGPRFAARATVIRAMHWSSRLNSVTGGLELRFGGAPR